MQYVNNVLTLKLISWPNTVLADTSWKEPIYRYQQVHIRWLDCFEKGGGEILMSYSRLLLETIVNFSR